MNITDAFRPPKTKVCKICKVEKPIDDFVIHVQNKDSRSSDCRACKKGKEEAKKQRRKEHAKTFFDARFFTLILLLSTSLSSFSQDTTVTLKQHNWSPMPTSIDSAWITTGRAVTRNDFIAKPDTIRAIILATMCRKCAAEAMPGYVVLEQGKRPVYLDCRKRALRGSRVGWDWRELGGKQK